MAPIPGRAITVKIGPVIWAETMRSGPPAAHGLEIAGAVLDLVGDLPGGDLDRGHELDLDLDAALAVEALVLGDDARQVGERARGDAVGDLLDGGRRRAGGRARGRRGLGRLGGLPRRRGLARCRRPHGRRRARHEQRKCRRDYQPRPRRAPREQDQPAAPQYPRRAPQRPASHQKAASFFLVRARPPATAFTRVGSLTRRLPIPAGVVILSTLGALAGESRYRVAD